MERSKVDLLAPFTLSEEPPPPIFSTNTVPVRVHLIRKWAASKAPPVEKITSR
jgi:hypothetical protein